MTTHTAPSVVYPLGRSGVQGCLLAGLWVIGLLVLLLWYDRARQVDWRICSGAVALGVAGVAAYIGWMNSPAGQIAWDGQFWRWESPGYQTGVAHQQLSVIADFQHLLLLRIENQAHASLWLWVERKAFPARWLDLRRAVYSPERLPALAQGPGVSGVAQFPDAVAVSGSTHTADLFSTKA